MALSLTAVVVAPALVWAAVSDLLYRRISNRLVLALLLAWGLWKGWELARGRLETGPVLISVLTATCVLMVGYVLFAMRWMGGGDAKLMAVLCLWMGNQALPFLMVTAIAGGILAMTLPLLRMAERVLGHGLMQINTRLPRAVLPVPETLGNRPAGGMPYGLAIACGAAFVLWGSA